MANYIQYYHGKSSVQQDSFYQQTGLKFKGETSTVLSLK